MPVPQTVILNFFSSTKNYSGWPSSKVDMFILKVYGVVYGGFLRILTLMMWVLEEDLCSIVYQR